jgi:GNAT superfamily N-acetyltransferase
MNGDLQARPPDGGTTLRPMRVGDLAAMHRLAQQMSWPHRLEDCAHLFRLGAGTVALDATGGAIGVGMRWSFGRDVGTIGMVLVAPERQGRGIGRALMTALIADSGPRALMLNATTEGLRLYQKLGFSPCGLVRQHQAQLDAHLAAHLAARLTEGPAMLSVPPVAVRRAAPADHAALCALDAAVFGADRSALVGPLLATGQTWTIGDDAARPTGFAVLRRFGRGTMIGPIVAPGEEEAIALVAAAARAAPAGALRVDIPECAERLGRWLAAAGLPAIDTVTTMRRGHWPATAAESQRFGLVLQALG